LTANKHFAQMRLLPLGRRDNRLILATSDPSDPKPIEELRQKMNVAIETVIVEHDKLVRQLSLANEAPAEIKSLFPMQEAKQIEYDAGAAAATRRTTADGIDDAPVVRFLQKLFTEALLRGASDLHFEPFETFYRVRFRIDGILAQVAQPPLDIRDKIATRIKVLSRLDISEKRVPQDGRMKLLITVPKDKKDKDNKETIERAIDFRVSTLPTLFGEKIVIRILESSTERLDIDQLGYEPEQKQLLLDV
ncbi:general secretion pathway protein GspE, partial [Desulfocarbo indianensis]